MVMMIINITMIGVIFQIHRPSHKTKAVTLNLPGRKIHEEFLGWLAIRGVNRVEKGTKDRPFMLPPFSHFYPHLLLFSLCLRVHRKRTRRQVLKGER